MKRRFMNVTIVMKSLTTQGKLFTTISPNMIFLCHDSFQLHFILITFQVIEAACSKNKTLHQSLAGDMFYLR